MYRNKMFLLICFVVVISYIFGYYAKINYKILNEKIVQQEKNIVDIKRWKNAYEDLKPYQEKWDSTYRDVDDINDMLSLYRSMGINRSKVFIDPERLEVLSVNNIEYNGRYLGLNQICLGTSGSSGLYVTSRDFSTLYAGVEDIASRKDVRMDRIEFYKKNQLPTAVLGNFCIYFKD